MAKKVISIEAGVWLTKVGLVDYKKTSPKIYKAFTFRKQFQLPLQIRKRFASRHQK